MSIAAEELRNQLSQTKKNPDGDKQPPAATESKGINLLSTFPWFYGIVRKCREAIGTKHANTLNGLLYAFVKELSVSIKDCYSRPNRAGILRDLVCQMLVYFNMVDRELKEECMDNNNTYLHLMTELLAMYLDLEIKASKRSVHSLKKIGQFMTTALYTHLGQSEDHIVEAILKAKLITKSSGELCAPVLSKVLNDGRCFVGDENAYVRFLLAFKLLQKITRRADRRDVTKMAVRKLDPAPELVRIVRRMTNIFPQQKIMDEPITSFLMNAKFDFIKAKLEFLRTGSISKGSPCDLYPEKPFAYGNQSNSITTLLKRCRKDEESDSASMNRSWPSEKNGKGCSADLDLDPSIYRLSGRGGTAEDDTGEIEFLGTRNRRDRPVELITLDSEDEDGGGGGGEKESEKEKIVGDGSDIKLESYKRNTSNTVPESDGNPENGGKTSTKHAGGTLPSTLQSPEHGVIESTNNFIGSENFRSPIRKTCDAQSSTDEGRTEVSSSLDFVDSTADLFNEDYLKVREPEITSTRDKTESFGDDLSNLSNDLSSALSLGSNRKKWDIACADSPRRFTPGDNGSDVISAREEGDAERCSSTSRSSGKCDRMSAVHNYPQSQPSEVDSGLERVGYQPGVIQKTESWVTTELLFDGRECAKPSPAKEGKVSQGSKNLVVTANLATPAKKVNYENVLKSYKIVKSKRLKVAELPVSSVGQSKDSSGRSGSRAPKFIKLDKSSVIAKVKEGVKFVSKSLDFRTSKAGEGEKGRSGSGKAAERKSVGSRTRTTQCVPIIFKKIDETGNQTKSKSSQRGGGSAKTSGPKPTGKRKTKSHSSSVIKTDINMKSTLKPINPSSIPQFAAEVAKESKRKCRESKVKCVGKMDSQEPRTVDIKLMIPDKFLGLKCSEAFLGQGSESSVIRPCIQYPNHDRTPYVPIPQADSTQEGSFNQFPAIYPTDQSLYCKKPDYPEPDQRFFVDEAKFEPQRPDANPFEDIFPVLGCDGVKPETGKDERNEEITDLVEHQQGLELAEDRRYDSHDRTSSVEGGMAFGSVWSSGKVTSSTPRDLIISEISVEDLNDVDEELRDLVEPWEGPRDCCPDDDEFFLSALPDPQKLFSVEDFSHLDEMFPSSNLNFDTLRPEDFGNMTAAFDDKCLYDIRSERDLDALESTFNENFFVLQDCDGSHTGGEADPTDYEPCKKSPRLSSPESRSDDQPKPRFKKGRRSSSSSNSSGSSSRGEKAGSSTRKGNAKKRMRSVFVEGNTGKVDRKKLRSDSVAYHTRSISQKGIPIEYTIAPPKCEKNKKSKPT